MSAGLFSACSGACMELIKITTRIPVHCHCICCLQPLLLIFLLVPISLPPISPFVRHHLIRHQLIKHLLVKHLLVKHLPPSVHHCPITSNISIVLVHILMLMPLSVLLVYLPWPKPSSSSRQPKMPCSLILLPTSVVMFLSGFKTSLRSP